MNKEKEKRAIEYLKAFEPESEPYYLCYSGGKDSDVIRILASLAGVKHDIVHNLTTVDAPETVRYVKSIPDIQINYPEKSMWQLIVEKKLPPTRFMRYCCEKLKEHGGKGRLKITGVRWAESSKRKESSDIVKIIGKPKTTQQEAENLGVDYRINKQGGMVLNIDNDKSRRFVEHCYRTTSTMVNPIVDWTDADVWEFLSHYGCKSNPLYQKGKCRVGCVMCPISGFSQMRREAKDYPKYRANYVRAFDRMLKAREEAGLENKVGWTDGESVMRWWLGYGADQMQMLDYFEDI